MQTIPLYKVVELEVVEITIMEVKQMKAVERVAQYNTADKTHRVVDLDRFGYDAKEFLRRQYK